LRFDVAVTQPDRRKVWGMEEDRNEIPSRNMCRLQLLRRSDSNLCAVGNIFPFFVFHIFCKVFFWLPSFRFYFLNMAELERKPKGA
jgi:hypothetical protein